MSEYKLLAVGSDMEFFLEHAQSHIPVPVIGLLGGTKTDPKPVPELGEGFAVQEDNVMPEVNIPPAKTAEEFSQNINKIVDYLKTTMKKYNLNVLCRPSMEFLPESLTHPQALTMGCEPDYNVWQRIKNARPDISGKHQFFRTAAAHVHVSFLIDGKFPKNKQEVEPVIKTLDMVNSLPFIFCDKDTKRRELYGRAGAFRLKHYGIEHRVLSNYWISDPRFHHWVFQGVEIALDIVNDLSKVRWLESELVKNYVQRSINNNDTQSVAMLLNHCGSFWKQLTQRRIHELVSIQNT